MLSVDGTTKVNCITDIFNQGFDVTVTVLTSDLTEVQTLKIEAELISAFGTEASGGILSNSVIPSGLMSRRRRDLIAPSGALEKAQLGIQLLKDAILQLTRANAKGITNADTA